MIENQKVYIVSARDSDPLEGIYGVYDSYEAAEQFRLSLIKLARLEIIEAIRNPGYVPDDGKIPYAVMLNKTGKKAITVFAEEEATGKAVEMRDRLIAGGGWGPK
ncbi:MAG TPA: hypothetical protein VK541_23350 [Pedobacter sp.]|uniref:hypothetical protein n=1 Tax=Pedobacter sp. TaxID=1411316 RepID=UPI002BABCAF2|nr:hypothetical protein [Pedobacter sp.]HMI05444.1 hypothetical protein [Pedobacter sp.]